MKDTIKFIEPDPTWMQKTGGYARDMTLRDYFAGIALQGLLSQSLKLAIITEQAYTVADAMLEARNK